MFGPRAEKARIRFFLCGLSVLALVCGAGAARKVPIDFDDYHGYTGAVKYLKDVAAAHPAIAELVPIGQSTLGRPIYVLVITNLKTGTTIDRHIALRHPREENVQNVTPPKAYEGKPGQWIDGGMHGNEYTGTEVCLYIIDQLVSGYGTDKETTRLVDTRTFYICPVVNPDGVFNSVERGLSQRQNSMLRDDDGDGKVNEDGPDDLDGDGFITQFRKKDPQGRYVVDDAEPRLMVRLGPNETTTKDRYLVVTEDKDNDGDKKRGEDPEAGIDVNRNFPEGWWNEEGFAGGTGDYPTASPEALALAEFFTTHRNIMMVQNFHTSGGFTYRPPGTAADPAMHPRDVAVYDLILGRKYLETIGEKVPDAWLKPEALDRFREELRKTSQNKYAAARGYEMPRGWIMGYNEERDRRYGFGMVIDWLYQQYGAFAVTTELWNPEKDIPGFPVSEGPDARRERERALLKYQDEKYGGKLFIPWKTFRHPELGEGEIGGWIPKYRSNAFPGAPLIGVCEKHWQFEKYRAGLLPELAVTEARAKVVYEAGGAASATAAERTGGVAIKKGKAIGPYKVVEVTAVIENKGALATQTARGATQRGNREDVVWLLGDRDKITFLQGTPWQRLGVIDGTMPIPGPAGRGGPRATEEPPEGPPPGMPTRIRRPGMAGPTEVRQTGPKREVTWLVAVEGDILLKVAVVSQKGGTVVRDVKVP
ncbi:MAG: M14 family metallopeptidase [Candidatus Aminicenantes bacterium]|nr:M14 family metallopeptidase [Candidatus Aminicenantes bacterium]